MEGVQELYKKFGVLADAKEEEVRLLSQFDLSDSIISTTYILYNIQHIDIVQK